MAIFGLETRRTYENKEYMIDIVRPYEFFYSTKEYDSFIVVVRDPFNDVYSVDLTGEEAKSYRDQLLVDIAGGEVVAEVLRPETKRAINALLE